MSHFVTLVLVDPDTSQPDAPSFRHDVEVAVSRLLAPYDENVDVPEYTTECWCVGVVAQRAVQDQLEAEMPIQALRDQILVEFPDLRDTLSDGKDVDARWQELVAPRKAREAELLATRLDANAPMPDCDTCHGSGRHLTTYNPKSQWDWWVIGGRWSGELGGRALQGNAQVVAELDPEKVEKIAYAIVTPDGAWHEEGKMGWFGMSHDDDPNWSQRIRQILCEFPRHLAVACDLHI